MNKQNPSIENIYIIYQLAHTRTPVSLTHHGCSYLPHVLHDTSDVLRTLSELKLRCFCICHDDYYDAVESLYEENSNGDLQLKEKLFRNTKTLHTSVSAVSRLHAFSITIYCCKTNH